MIYNVIHCDTYAVFFLASYMKHHLLFELNMRLVHLDDDKLLINSEEYRRDNYLNDVIQHDYHF